MPTGTPRSAIFSTATRRPLSRALSMLLRRNKKGRAADVDSYTTTKPTTWHVNVRQS
jgi:hypothetical protein